MTVCRTPQLGGHIEQCPHGGFARYAYHSCRKRHYPKCQTMTGAQWVADCQAECLPVPYFHCVFTLPHALNPLVLRHPRPLLTLLCQAVRQTLLQCGHQHLGGQSGGTIVLPTWEQTLGAHCHLHCLIPAGALAPDGTQWLPASARFLFPVQALRTVFRGQCLGALRQLCTLGAVCLAGEPTAVEPPVGCQQWWDQLYSQAWVVSIKPAFSGPAQVLDALGRSTHRVAIATHRIVEVGDGSVRFTSRNRRQDNQVQTMALEAPECIRRFLLHVVPRACSGCGISGSWPPGARLVPSVSVGNSLANLLIPRHATKRRLLNGCGKHRHGHYSLSILWPQSSATDTASCPAATSRASVAAVDCRRILSNNGVVEGPLRIRFPSLREEPPGDCVLTPLSSHHRPFGRPQCRALARLTGVSRSSLWRLSIRLLPCQAFDSPSAFL